MSRCGRSAFFHIPVIFWDLMERREHWLWKSDLLHLQCEFQVHSNMFFYKPCFAFKQLSQYKNVPGINEVFLKKGFNDI